jgi:formate dehydrogenase subunit gamma
VIERYPFHERICHWLTGFAYIYCLATGLAFYTPYLFWIAVVLGGAPTSRFWHPVTGLVFFGAAMWMHHIWRGDVALGPEDKEWLDKAKFYVTNEDEKVPPQGKYNAGQKIFYWAMYFGAMLLLLSGALMWFPELVPAGLRWIRPLAIFVHEGAALITIGAFMIHVYMGVFMVPGGVEAMLHGSVTKDWAKAHHRLWFHQKTGE